MESTNYIVNGIEFELSHAGTKGMKWGRRLYQNKDGSLTALGRMRYRKEQKVAQAKKAAALEKRKATIEAKKKAAEEAKAKEAERERIVKTGSASELLKIKDTMTKSEMDAAWARITWEQNMYGAAAKETAAAGKSKFDKVFDGLDGAVTKAQTLAKAWNTIANVYNAFSKNAISLPKIDTDIAKGNKVTRKEEKKNLKKEQDAEKAAKEKAEKEATEKAEKEAKAAKEQKLNAQREQVRRQATNSSVNRFINTVKPPDSKSSRSAVDNILGDEIDFDFVAETPVSNASRSTIALGQTYIAGLLPPPKDD